jgi:hypothetical protein
MNIIYETTKERGATILIPTAMVDCMNPASALVLANTAVLAGETKNGAVKPPFSGGSPSRRVDGGSAE